MIAARFAQVLIAASCSKNFGIYRERTGILIALSDAGQRATVQGNLAFLNRQNFSFPPDHGARLVTMILDDAALCADWKAELEEVRLNMLGLRQGLADALRLATNSDRFDFVALHRGMFSRLGLTPGQVQTLRTEHGIYMVGDSRVNIAGLNALTVPVLHLARCFGRCQTCWASLLTRHRLAQMAPAKVGRAGLRSTFWGPWPCCR